MIKIQKETVTKRYREDGIYVETIIQFHYDTETEKLNHSREMQKSGFEDSGQVRENVGDMLHPDYVWFGSYYKHIKVEDNVLPDMREKVREYIIEMDEEISRCMAWIEDHMDGEACQVSAIKMRAKTLNDVKNDLQGRLEELV